jgi:CCR4-NOT transcription complex subunit 7/8
VRWLCRLSCAQDTEFPGVVARPLTTPPAGAGKASMDAYRYATIKCNVELLRMLQLGLCFCNEHGEIAARTPNDTDSASAATGVVFQFHFKFNLDSDLYASDSIELLQQSGLDLARHGVDGIDVTEFAELLLTSGIVLNDEVRWLTFHAGFDFAYLLHVLLGGGQGGSSSSTGNVSLPASEQDFFELISLYFPCIFDVKSLVVSGN